MEGEPDSDACLNTRQVYETSLVTLQLLTLVCHYHQFKGQKYKCTVSLDFIRAVARTVNFDIIKYLYDLCENKLQSHIDIVTMTKQSCVHPVM
ncbi:Origin recognition complex subunit 5 [Sciurus carolinensis]|uniref:Origin recognition complex subunit 5 n=1 Tax=Sciurus carolinensis TaxID=30640 RepID=A0AA41STK0_SCICA|nr:Origin recognition complex subunit 5 [Sciurus carolinensis]